MQPSVVGIAVIPTIEGQIKVRRMKKKDNAWKWLPLFDAAELAVRIGLISSAAFVAVLGQFVLAGILLVIAVGVFLRFKRKKK